MSSSRHRKPTKSSRVPPQAREYISAMAEDRELERFMAFSSTASSGASGSTHSCALGPVLPPRCASVEHGLRPESGHRRRPKSSDHAPDKEKAEEQLLELPLSPPISKHTISQSACPKSKVTPTKSDEYTIIPILLASSPSFRPVAATQTMSQSADDLRTPTKSPQMQSKKTQTPESALKSHKRLEWDPAADVGYCKRALSTSNISTLERSVLVDCGWRQPTQQRAEADTDMQRQEAVQPLPMLDKPTPPLACSTFVNRSDRLKPTMDSLDSSLSSRKGDSREKSQSKSRREDSGSSSRHKDSRSSSRKDSMQSSSKEIGKGTQCSANREGSLIDSTNEGAIDSRRNEDLRLSSRVQDPQISSRRASESSSRRESLSSYRRDDSRLNSQNSSRLGSRVSSRAENSRSSSMRESQATSLYGSSAASSFDYHIHGEQEFKVVKQDQGRQNEKGDETKEQLEKEQQPKDLRQGEPKRKEQRDKDEHLEREQKGIQKLAREQRKAEQREKEREQERRYTAAQFEKILGSRRHENKENQQPQNPSTGETANASTSSSSIEIGSGGRPRGELDLGIDLLCSLVKTRSLSQGQKKKLVRDIARRIACLDLAESSTSLRSLSNTKEQLKVSTGSQQRQDAATNTTQSSSRSSSKAERIALPVPAPRKRGTAGTPSPLPASLTHSGSTSASREVITQKTNVPTREAASTDADVEPSDLQEWLNPMTQSEIEYEQRLKGGTDSERRQQLNWIDTEIRRLEGLQKLLFNTIATLPNSSHIEAGKEYLLPQEMQADAFEEVDNPETPATPPPPVRIESVGATLRELPQTPAPTPPAPPPPPPHLNQQKPQNRKKMATPVLASSSSTSGGGRSESVCSFVQQRQRQFREHYQNQQQQQLLLLQQQKLHQQQKQLNQQKDLLKQKQQRCAHCAHCGHQRTHVHQQHCPYRRQHQEATQDQHDEREHYMQMQYAQAAESANATPLQSGSAGYSCADSKEAIYYQVVNSQGAASYVQATMVSTGAQNEASATGGAGGSAISRSTTTTTSSSTSMMCISSDMSIPMGMVNTCETTTTTTTHQYDDVACQRVRRLHKETRKNAERMQRQTLHVRPRAIAYSIQFTPTGDSEVFPETRSLQDQLQLARPEFCAKSKQRKAILNEMQMIRNHRRQELDNLLCENTSLETLDRRLQQLPPPATSRLRIFTTKQMKAMTTKRCQSLPEVLAAQNRQQEERRRRCNRLMRDVFNKRLHNRVANGQISLNHSMAII
ncbi:AF4/FMR2 family member 4 isoform X2 [Drosophila erecta]|uniref:ALMS motif domain-containing protein n=1 Tax=Drosophila erecta TaxID=7220 RepID=B3NU45_DROER|nr:AF4/FMR2 family member 4 isoform X2 [Drosophila erecta]EDV45821.2 uncharacterized protein Dere_GG18532 [Drosophila erecta]